MALVKAALLTEIMSPYRIPVFNKIAEDRRVDFQVIFLAEMTRGRKWVVNKNEMKFTHHLVRGIGIPLPERFPIFFNPGVFQKLCQINPDIVICGGYHHPSFFLAFLYAKLFKKEFLLWCETHALSVRMKQPFAVWYRKLAVHAASRYLVPGKLSFDFLHSLGALREKIYVMPNAVDNRFFYSASNDYRQRKEEIKSQRGFPKRLILYVGRLISFKGVQVLLDAFGRLPAGLDAGLLIVGDGPKGKSYQVLCRKRHWNVFFEGFKQQNEIPLYYGISDLFILPSEKEEWGLVLNEAMASGLPVIASDQVGAGYDLIREGVNGFQFSSGDSDTLGRLIGAILSDESLRIKMGRSSLDMISNYSPEQSAAGFLRAIFHEQEKERQLPFISIIMPSYNQGRFIQTAIDSVLGQAYPNLECIVVDAGSTDSTLELLGGYGGRLTVHSRPGFKQSETMNEGLRLAKGDLIAFLNADDSYVPGACRLAAEYFLKHPATDMIYGDFHIVDESGTRLAAHREINFDYQSYLFLGRFISYPTVFFKRQIVKEVGEFDTSLDHAMDHDYWLRVAQSRQIEHIPEIIANYRWRSENKSIVDQDRAHRELRIVQARYRKRRFSSPWLEELYYGFFFVVYKLRRICRKLILGRYWENPPTPLLFYLWKRRLPRENKTSQHIEKEPVNAKI